MVLTAHAVQIRRMPRRLPLLLFLALLAGLTSGCTILPFRSQQAWRSLTRYDYPSEPVGTPEFEKLLDAYTGTAARNETACKLLQNGDNAYPIMLGLIASAQHTVFLETYIVERDQTTDDFFKALKDAAERGVQVRVIADAAGFGRGLIAQLHELDSPNIEARIFNPFFLSWTIVRGNNRDHRKILAVDGKYAILGGINISDEQTGDGITGWRDTSLLVAGEAARDAEKVFAQTWRQAGRGWVGKDLPVSPLNPLKKAFDMPFMEDETLPGSQSESAAEESSETKEQPPSITSFHTKSASVRVVSSSPDTRNSPLYDMAILGALGARERLDITCAYFVPPLGLRRALLAAAQNGVQVRLLLPKVTDVKLVREMGMRFYGELLRSGVRIYEWPHPILHAKTMAVDGRWLVVGSANMDSRSYFLNYEASLAATDAALAGEAHRQFDKDLLQAEELSLEEWERRSAKQRLLEILLIPLAGQY